MINSTYLAIKKKQKSLQCCEEVKVDWQFQSKNVNDIKAGKRLKSERCLVMIVLKTSTADKDQCLPAGKKIRFFFETLFISQFFFSVLKKISQPKTWPPFSYLQGLRKIFKSGCIFFFSFSFLLFPSFSFLIFRSFLPDFRARCCSSH